jgi:exo-beta-1,3-glucanase (GH17 family)/cellulose synthase/poly-beta-1,6-N-acetylglucosamine synthase-like glycosyltransferase
MRIAAVICALITCVHAGLWHLMRSEVSAPDYSGPLASVSYTPFDGSAHPDSPVRTTAAQVRADLGAIAQSTQAIRTYSSTGGSEIIPEIADEFGLGVSMGAWIDRDDSRNERELQAVINLARTNRNIDSVIVGNETIYRADQSVADIIAKIKRVKRAVTVPVSTGEIWNVWLEHPELVSAVDFIAAHVLPYWEGVSEKEAVAQTLRIHAMLKKAYPGKRIVIAEFGWPSQGHNRRNANPGPLAQASVLRQFLSAAKMQGIEYNIIEAYDQPWKTFEGGVGPYWGIYDTSRQPKFEWTGPIVDPNYWNFAGIAIIIGLLLSLPILSIPGATLGQSALMASAAHGIGAWSAYAYGFWSGHYFVPGAAFAFAFGSLLLIPLIIIMLARVEEIAAIAFGRKPLRLLGAGPNETKQSAIFEPKVSIHIPAYREPPEMLKATLDAVAKLDYRNFECIVIINNTPDPALWEPVEAHCRVLGGRFKFVREDHLTGFKAGALRLALEHTAPDAEIIGVLDADYVVQPEWLKDLIPAFADPHVGLVQAPQDHRDGDRSVMHRMLNSEYAGFFDIGMVQRNESNAIITHGTMCLIRRAALEDAGGWSSDTICEDTDLGLTILEQGWCAQYTDRRYGHGLLPDTFAFYKRQHHRWASGGVQIAKKHWRNFLPGASSLCSSQKQTFALGWLTWLGAETVGVAVALLNLALVPFVAFAGNVVPDAVLTVPILASFIVSLLHFVVLYRLRVRVALGAMIGGLIAAMSLQWTIARAVSSGLVKDKLPFIVTAKGGSVRRSRDFPAFWEGVIGALLLVSAVLLYSTNWERVREINLFAAVLAAQSLPFLAAIVLATLEGLRMNDFSFWRGLRERMASLIPRRAPSTIVLQPSRAERPTAQAQYHEVGP